MDFREEVLSLILVSALEHVQMIVPVAYHMTDWGVRRVDSGSTKKCLRRREPEEPDDNVPQVFDY